MMAPGFRIAIFVLIISLHARAEILQIPEIFDDDMVVQRDVPVRIWGKGGADLPVVVSNAEAGSKRNRRGFRRLGDPVPGPFRGRSIRAEYSSGLRE